MRLSRKPLSIAVSVDHRSLLMRIITAVMAISLILAVTGAVSVSAESTSSENAGEFLRKLTGEWVGTCEQSTDGEQAEDKYFYVMVREIEEGTFESRFDYYRLDPKTQAPIPAGSSTIVTTVEEDGSAKSVISGQGTVMVFEKPKSQEHELTEVITAAAGGLRGEGSGAIQVAGMPLGLGKNGKVTSAQSSWTLENGVLSVRQTLKVGFKALFIQKNFDIVASYKAQRGSDIASLIHQKSRMSSTFGVGI